MTSKLRRAGARRFGASLAGNALRALALTVLLVVGPLGTSPAVAAPASPHWNIVSESEPTYFKSGDTSDAYVLVVRNDGAAATQHGDEVTITDSLPAGVTAIKVSAEGEGPNSAGSPAYAPTCSTGSGSEPVTCTYEEGPKHGPILAGATIAETITVSVQEGVETLGPNSPTVAGGGAPSAATEETTPIDDEPVPFGLAFFDVDSVEEAGELDEQAGSHPFELTTSLAFNVSGRESPSAKNGGGERPLADAATKDIEVTFPPGLIGDPQAVPQCNQQAFLEGENLNCPVDTQVGTVRPRFYGAFASAVYPVFNLVPPAGAPAELGFSVSQIGRVTIFFHEQRNAHGEYGLVASLNGIPESGPLQSAALTLWGVPAEASHDLEREGTVGDGGQQDSEFCKPLVEFVGEAEKQTRCVSDAPGKPFLTLPTQCRSESLSLEALTDSWEGESQSLSPGPAIADQLTGCEHLAFAPSLTLTPETTQAQTPSGYTVELRLPQNEAPAGLAAAELRDAAVTLPAGVVVSPSATNGLLACTPAQFAVSSTSAASCPPQSQIGTVEITTPILSNPLEGRIFLGEPECAPCTPADAQEGKLIRLQLQAQGSGVTVKLEGSAAINQSTGQLTVTFRESPQLPFEDLKLTLNGGSRAPLANAAACGTALAATSSLTPYSSETPAQPSSEPFELSGCSTPSFQPSFVAGTTNNQAGGFSPLTLRLSRTDQDEDLQSLSVRLAPGLIGMLSKVPLCPQAQAEAGACEAQSEIGSATVGAGPGPEPVFVNGSIYLTGPYEGAPFGLSIVVPAEVGPLDLGTIVVGATVEVNPTTAALTITSGPLPQSLDGIPLQVKTINLDIDREGFMFNPTDCRPLAIEGTAESGQSLTAPVSSRFQAANCAALAFKPKLSGLTHAKTSKARGAYLHLRIASTPGQANIAKVKIDLPKQLTARLSTLQHACLATVIEVDPARCPPASVLGSVTIITPVLHQPFVGPVYVVSHGRSALPALEFVLQGEGVTVDVVGQTRFQHGILAGTFSSLPDVPISTLGLVLTEGPHSLLAANLPASSRAGLCGQTLAMPTEITGENGAVLKQTTKIAVSGCTKHKRRRKAEHSKAKHEA
jgi:uncharacterized repeat protein (TIGR01451 family)